MSMYSILEKHKSNNIRDFTILIFIGVLSIVLSIVIGASTISLEDFWRFASGQQVDDFVKNIITLVRVPRALGGFLCGFALSLSGLLLQRVLNNALVSPSTIGVNSGSGLFVLVSTLIFPLNFFAKTLAAFLGAITISLIIYFVSIGTGRSRMTIILAGVAITTMCNAIIDSIIIVFPDSVYDKTAFYIGGLSSVTYTQLTFSSIFILVGFFVVMLIHKQLDILILGDEVSNSLGVNVNKIRFIIILCSSMISGAAVAVAGLLGFVGLIIPHIAKMLFDNESKTLIPKTSILGGSFVVLADLFARVLFAPYEIPVGVLLSFLGAPFFLFLLFNGKKKGRFV
ncbi:MAG: FecCD family ABC transporter permease [Lachnospirales bacterium]